MSYKHFKLTTLEENLGITTQTAAFIPEQLPEFKVSDLLLRILADNENTPLATEKAKSELIISPVLKELQRHNQQCCTVFSGYEFNVDKQRALNGYCDFILSALPNTPIIKAPVFCLVEAKKGDVSEGFGQCGAEMAAAQLFNQQHHSEQKHIYGCVTNAFSWVFLQLKNDKLFIDPRYVPLTFQQPQNVLTVLQWIVNSITV